jgi:hypothetical protein
VGDLFLPRREEHGGQCGVRVALHRAGQRRDRRVARRGTRCTPTSGGPRIAGPTRLNIAVACGKFREFLVLNDDDDIYCAQYWLSDYEVHMGFHFFKKICYCL